MKREEKQCLANERGGEERRAWDEKRNKDTCRTK